MGFIWHLLTSSLCGIPDANINSGRVSIGVLKRVQWWREEIFGHTQSEWSHQGHQVNPRTHATSCEAERHKFPSATSCTWVWSGTSSWAEAEDDLDEEEVLAPESEPSLDPNRSSVSAGISGLKWKWKYSHVYSGATLENCCSWNAGSSIGCWPPLHKGVDGLKPP